jgi:predicted RecB family endonuclease
MSKPNLPPLPPRLDWHDEFGIEVYADYQMRAYAEEAVRQALVEAAAICNRKFIAMAEGGFPREASTARKLTAEIVALLPENSDG